MSPPTPTTPSATPSSTLLPAYAELQCLSNFSFLRGAAWPQDLVARAQALGYEALALTDECSVAGAVRAHGEARRLGFKLIIGAQFRLPPDPVQGDPGGPLVLLATNRRGYGQLCQLITQVRAGQPKGEYQLGWADLQASPARLADCLALWSPERDQPPDAAALARVAQGLAASFPGRAWLAVRRWLRMDDARWLEALQAAGQTCGLPLVAVGDVHMHRRSDKPLHDVLSAIRLRHPVAECGLSLQANAEAHLRSRLRLATLFPPELLAESVRVAARCRFSLDELRYEYPPALVPPGLSPAQHLRHEVEAGVRRRYPEARPRPCGPNWSTSWP